MKHSNICQPQKKEWNQTFYGPTICVQMLLFDIAVLNFLLIYHYTPFSYFGFKKQQQIIAQIVNMHNSHWRHQNVWKLHHLKNLRVNSIWFNSDWNHWLSWAGFILIVHINVSGINDIFEHGFCDQLHDINLFKYLLSCTC